MNTSAYWAFHFWPHENPERTGLSVVTAYVSRMGRGGWEARELRGGERAGKFVGGWGRWSRGGGWEPRELRGGERAGKFVGGLGGCFRGGGGAFCQRA